MRLQGRWVEGGTEILLRCPRCGRDKLFVNPWKRMGYCQRCRWVPSADDLKDLSTPREQAVSRLRKVPHLVPAWESSDAVEYLRDRGVFEEHPDIYYDADGRRLYFRLTPLSSEFHPSYHTRGVDEGTGWIVFPGTQKQHYAWGESYRNQVCLTEGIFDALAVGCGGVAMLGTRLSGSLFSALRRKRVFLFLDPDEAGQEATTEIKRIIPDARIIRAEREPSECDPFELKQILKEAGWCA